MQNFIIAEGQRNENSVFQLDWQIHKDILNKNIKTSWVFIQIIPKNVCGHVCYVGSTITWVCIQKCLVNFEDSAV